MRRRYACPAKTPCAPANKPGGVSIRDLLVDRHDTEPDRAMLGNEQAAMDPRRSSTARSPCVAKLLAASGCWLQTLKRDQRGR